MAASFWFVRLCQAHSITLFSPQPLCRIGVFPIFRKKLRIVNSRQEFSRTDYSPLNGFDLADLVDCIKFTSTSHSVTIRSTLSYGTDKSFRSIPWSCDVLSIPYAHPLHVFGFGFTCIRFWTDFNERFGSNFDWGGIVGREFAITSGSFESNFP